MRSPSTSAAAAAAAAAAASLQISLLLCKGWWMIAARGPRAVWIARIWSRRCDRWPAVL